MVKGKDEVLTTKEACEYLRISRPTCPKLIYTNQIKARKVRLTPRSPIMKLFIRSVVSVIGAVFFFFCLIGHVHRLQAGQFTALGTILFYLLICFLFIVRCPSEKTSLRFKHWLFALAGTFLPLFLMPNQETPVYLVWMGLPLQLLGMGFSLVALVSLGRSFGIIAAKRGLRTNGTYRLVRHPLYTGEAIWFLSIVIMNLSIYNVFLFCVQMGCQVQRMIEEETLLKQDETYCTYLEQIRYRMIPKIF